MGKEVNDTTEEVHELDNRMYAIEKAQALSNKDIQYIKETVDDILRKVDGLIK